MCEESENLHIPVLLNKVIEYLSPSPGKVIVDCTAGTGGHSLEIGRRIAPDGHLVMIDRDQAVLQTASKRVSSLENVSILAENYSALPDILEHLGITGIDGILFDLGVSSIQLDTAERGFSFHRNGPLDMRMNQDEDTPTAADIVNTWPRKQLAQIFREYSDERLAGKIAAAIDRQRKEEPLRDTLTLAETICRAYGPKKHRIHPATRTFQALRIAVNRELDSLKNALGSGFEHLNPSGRMVVLAFHSVEDRIVKNFFRCMQNQCYGKILTKKPILPNENEINENPRARSAKLRAVEKS